MLSEFCDILLVRFVRKKLRCFNILCLLVYVEIVLYNTKANLLGPVCEKVRFFKLSDGDVLVNLMLLCIYPLWYGVGWAG